MESTMLHIGTIIITILRTAPALLSMALGVLSLQRVWSLCRGGATTTTAITLRELTAISACQVALGSCALIWGLILV